MASELYKPISISDGVDEKNFKKVIDDNFINLARHLNDIRGWIEIVKITGLGNLAVLDTVDTAEIDNDAVNKDKMDVLGVDADGKLVLTQIGTSVTKLEDIVNDLGTQVAGLIQAGVVVASGIRTVMDYTVSTDCTNFTISSLTGDTDEEWYIHCLWKKNGSDDANFGIQPNADTGANYGFRTMYGAGASESNVLTYVNNAYTYLWMGRADTDHYYSQGYGRMNTKTGFIRQLMGLFSRDLTGATANGLYTMTDVWNNTVDEITSMLFLCSVSNGIHAGSRVFAYKRVA